MKLTINISEPIKTILSILEKAGGKPRIVGGAVRDAIVGILTDDIDTITTFEPEDVIDILEKHNVMVKETGIKYGTVTAYLGGCHTQITTLRVDKDCDGRHTNPEFTDDFEADAMRRDFTINAMSYAPFTGELYDYTSGYDDLMAGKVVFIGDPEKRIEEDYLRILRFFRFSNKFAKAIDEVSLEACIKLRAGLKNLSKERILMEISKMMESETCHKIVTIMIDNKILEEVMPVELFTDLLVDIHENAPKSLYADIFTNFAALMYQNPATKLKKELDDMRFASRAIDKIVALVKFRSANLDLFKRSLGQIEEVILPLWVDHAYTDSYLLISELWKSPYFKDIHCRLDSVPPKFPITGEDVMAKGFKGAAIKKELERLKKEWIKGMSAGQLNSLIVD